MSLPCLALACVSLATGAWALDFSDDFSAYQEGSDASPVWDTAAVAWEVREGKLLVDDPSGVAVLAGQPCFRRISVEATLTLRKAVTTSWKTAAVAIQVDNDNFWHLALVEAPNDLGRLHYVELYEMRNGNWAAQQNLQQTASAPGYDWQYDTPYRLRIALTPEGIEGQVCDMTGRQLVRLAYAFTAEAVTFGRPALRSGGFRGLVDDVKVAAADPVPGSMPGETPKTYPPYAGQAPGLFTTEATGFFRTVQRDGRWWLVDPNGKSFLAIGTDHCRYEGHWCQKLGYAPYGRKNDAKYKSRDEWAAQATDRLKSWGFNLLGAGNSREARYRGLAHTEFISFGSTFAGTDSIVEKTTWTGFPNVFSPRWPRFCEISARQACMPHRTDPWLFGYFLDNELEWFGKSWGMETGLFDEAMKRPADHTAKRALVEQLRAKYPTIADLNAAWGTDLPSFEAILDRDALSGSNAETVRADKIAFVRLCAEEYFRHTTAAIRKADPNHLILGCRFAGSAPAGIWDIAGKHCDIVTFNSYDRVDLEAGVAPGVAQRFESFFAQAQKPMMITEWSFPALDSGLLCTAGAGMRVDTQAQKAECFRIYQEMIFRLPFMVGSNYFMWVDEPALGISDTFPEDSNYGLVNEDDVPYRELTEMAARVHKTVYALHNGDYPDLGVREGYVVYNRGKAAATFTVRTWLDGEKHEQEIALSGGEDREVKPDWTPAPGGHLVVLEVDPERKTGDADPGDNTLVQVAWAPGLQVPEELRGAPCAALVVANQSGRELPAAVASVSTSALPADVAAGATAFRAATTTGQSLVCQYTSGEVAVAVGTLGPWSCKTILVSRCDPRDVPQAQPVVSTTGDGDRTVIGNGALTLLNTHQGGNVLDEIRLGDTLLGSYNPLVWQEVAGQNQWVRTSGLKELNCSGSAVRGVLDVTTTGGTARPITAVDDKGNQEAQRSLPQAFEVSHRIIIYPDQPWFLARLNWIRNTSDRPLTLKGYFFYLLSAIGGEAKGDRPWGPGVPNYYANVGAAWVDEEAGVVFGAIPLDDRIQAYFWLDKGGQRPDARRQLEPPVVLQPGETYEDKDQPWLLVYGGKVADKPWQEMKQVAAGFRALTVTVHEGPF